MMFSKSLVLLAAALGTASTVQAVSLDKVTVCIRKDATEGDYLVEVVDPNPFPGGMYDIKALFIEQGYTIDMPGTVVTIGGVSVTLDGECSHDVKGTVTLCIRGIHDDGPCSEETLEDDYESEQSFKDYLEKNGLSWYLPGAVVPYKGGTGVVQKDCSVKPPGATSYGDPHFDTWNGDKFDFHGACDLVLFSNPGFANGLGLNVHIRTTIKTWWSYIESAVVQIGENTIEIHGGDKEAKYYVNGEKQGLDLQNGETTLGEFPVSLFRITDHQGRIRVDLGDGDAISMETYKNFVRVNMGSKTTQKWEGSAGLLGSFPEGKMFARDGKTIFGKEKANEYGLEWQVRPSEGMLFHDMEGAQAPQQCVMPDKTQKRKLGESMMSQEDAAEACAHVTFEDLDECIYDVLSTNDIDLAGSY